MMTLGTNCDQRALVAMLALALVPVPVPVLVLVPVPVPVPVPVLGLGRALVWMMAAAVVVPRCCDAYLVCQA